MENKTFLDRLESINEQLNLTHYWIILLKFKRILFITPILIAVLGYLIALNINPIFQSSATLVIEKSVKNIVDIEEVPEEDTNKYGVISGVEISNNIFKVDDMVEKPDPEDAPSNLAIIGRYILTPEIFDVIKSTKPGKGGEIQITDALLTLAKEGKVLAYKFEGKRFDCGSVDGFVEATNYVHGKMGA